MKKTALFVSLLLAVNRLSAFPYFDPFSDQTAAGGSSYSVGSQLATQNDGLGDVWNAVGTTFPGAAPMIVSGNLTYPNMPQSTGNSVSFVPASSTGARLNFNATNNFTTRSYYSYLLAVTDLSAVPTTAANNYFAGFSDGSVGQGAQLQRVAARLVTKKSGAGYVIGLSKDNSTADNVYDTTVHNLNEVVFIVASYDRIGGTTNVNMWIDPNPSTFGSNTPPAATLTSPAAISSTGDMNTAGIQGYVILCQNTTAPSGIIDDMRIGTNWSFVTGGDPAIVTPPANANVAAGNNAIFTVVARGTPTLAYKWVKNGTTILSDVGNISGSGTATLTVSNIGSGDLGTYAVYVTNGVGSFVLSAPATLSFLTDPTIAAQPQNFSTNFGGTATFQVTAGGTAPFSYQWHKSGAGDLTDGGNITGSHSNILTLTGVAFPDGANYSVTVSNSLGSLLSTPATLSVADPYIVTQPAPVTANSGSTVMFHVVADGSGGAGSFTYEWFQNGNFIFDNGHFAGTSTDTLSINNISTADQAGYTVEVINGFSNAVSAVANLTVKAPAAISIPPRARTVVAGVNVAFSVVAAGSGPFTYTWQLNGANISGATSTSYVVTNAQTGVAGNYSVIISNAFSSVTNTVPLVVSNSLTLSQNNLVVVRVGDGAQTLGVNGNSMFLDQYAIDGTYINTITIPDGGTNAMTAIGMDNINGVNSGSTTGSVLTQSLDGRFMVVAGYATNLTYGTNLSTSFATNVPRGIALIDSFGQYNLAVASTSSVFDQTFWRSAISDGTNNFWGAGGISGTYYFGFGSPAAIVQTNFLNSRSMALFNGNIYCAGAAAGQNGVLKLTGMPTTASTPAVLFAGSTGTFDLTVSPDGNTIYVADQRTVSGGGGLQRFQFDGSNWSLAYTITAGFGTLGPRYVTADFSGANPVVYVTSNDQTLDNDRIIKVVDTGSGSTGTAIASAGSGQTFRSIRFGPIPNTVVPRPVLSFSASGNSLVLSWPGSSTLQSATNATGTYTNISGAASPFTTNMTDPQRFFRLKQ